EEYDLRRNNILDVTQHLVYTKGYELMSIQDILTELNISKGAFYHYFTSKQDLMEGLIERMATQAIDLMTPIVEDQHLDAAQKMLRIFDFAARWKTARMEVMMTLVKVWYADENALLRQKTQDTLLPRIAPLITRIIRQGNDEGVFHTAFPEQTCEIVFSMMMGIGDSMIKHLIQKDPTLDVLKYLEGLTTSYQEAMERVLGATPGSLPLFDPALLREWFPPSNGHI
ncbi:MAG TPA: TetR/AcrR family transcriptional regulator, partial [Anaerolineales bacterium]|nr:TetR/AcrR family transcriptional regulator [Anaerolineales bacterium]